MKSLKKTIAHALSEDIGRGDITSHALIPPTRKGQAYVIAKENAILCGFNFLPYLFPSPAFQIQTRFKDGSKVKKGTRILTIKGSLKKILERERVFLNFLGFSRRFWTTV